MTGDITLDEKGFGWLMNVPDEKRAEVARDLMTHFATWRG